MPPLPPRRSTGVFRGHEAHEGGQLPGIVEAGEVTQFGDDGQRDDPLHAPEGLQRLHHRIAAPARGEVLEFRLDALQTVDLLIDGAHGIWHLANQGATSWADFGKRAADLRGYNAELVLPVAASTVGWTALRPMYSALGSERGIGLMQPLEAALERYTAECKVPL